MAPAHLGTQPVKDAAHQRVNPVLELLMPNSKKVEQIKQSVLFHAYLGELDTFIFYTLQVLVIVDIGLLQAIP